MHSFSSLYYLCSITCVITENRTGTTRHIVRVMEYIEGEMMDVAGLTPKLAYQGGAFAARMSNVMEVLKIVLLYSNDLCFHFGLVQRERESLYLCNAVRIFNIGYPPYGYIPRSFFQWNFFKYFNFKL